jgi:sucrose synthase
MQPLLAAELKAHRDDIHRLISRYRGRNKPFLLRSELTGELQRHLEEDPASPLAGSSIAELIFQCQEAATDGHWVYLARRPAPGRWRHHRLHVDSFELEDVTVSEYLAFKERLVTGHESDDAWPLEIDLEPFNREFPRMQEPRSIGQGVSFLNRRLCARLFRDGGFQQLIDFLRVHNYRGRQLMLAQRIDNDEELRRNLRRAEALLQNLPEQTPWSELEGPLRELGFECGWGRDAARALDTLRLLSDVLEAPEPGTLERLLARVPMIFSIVILSPHGFFGQSGVLGLPDTGGQVVYILDQTRALEHEMVKRLREQGLDVDPQILVVTRLLPEARGTSCDTPREHIAGTRNAHILRVPFRAEDGSVVPQWISRFDIWPYLERFSREAEREILSELGERPGILIGNYSDGNLVASLLSRRMRVTQCTIAHALEKAKYLMSDLHWKDNEEQYHFSLQFTADLIAMNTSDFIITSTYQEIAGTQEGVGQYESYRSFTLPGLFRVVDGIDVYDPRFNIVSPGADPDVYFPYSDEERRLPSLHEGFESLIFGDAGGLEHRGLPVHPERPLIFTMARLDRIKNLTGLVDWFGSNLELRDRANLFVIGGHVDTEQCHDREEKDQAEQMHRLFDRHELDGCARWVPAQSDRVVNGELYRYIADRRGVFVQPALFEAYGLTVIEAMTSGLPVFATCFGGPLEIIEDGRSGFHIDPNRGDLAAARMAEFFRECRRDPEYWTRISDGAIRRVEERYTWKLYGERMMTLARVYGFWKYVTNLERQETRRYLQMFYGLQYRQRVARMKTKGENG